MDNIHTYENEENPIPLSGIIPPGMQCSSLHNRIALLQNGLFTVVKFKRDRSSQNDANVQGMGAMKRLDKTINN